VRCSNVCVSCRPKVSKVLCIVILNSKYTRALTFENLVQYTRVLHIPLLRSAALHTILFLSCLLLVVISIALYPVVFAVRQASLNILKSPLSILTLYSTYTRALTFGISDRSALGDDASGTRVGLGAVIDAGVWPRGAAASGGGNGGGGLAALSGCDFQGLAAGGGWQGRLADAVARDCHAETSLLLSRGQATVSQKSLT